MVFPETTARKKPKFKSWRHPGNFGQQPRERNQKMQFVASRIIYLPQPKTKTKLKMMKMMVMMTAMNT